MPERPLPPQLTMGLLDYLSTFTMDQDYQETNDRRQRSQGPGAPKQKTKQKIGVGAFVVCGLFACMLMVSSTQTTQSEESQAKDRDAVVQQVQDRHRELRADRARIEELNRSTTRLRAMQSSNSSLVGGLGEEVIGLGLATGMVASKGPGVKIVIDDAPQAKAARDRVIDSDLQQLVNGLWEAGAEGIAINGQRLTALTAIRHAGSAITVNFTSLARPYTVTAIGNADSLPARFTNTGSGQLWTDLRRRVDLRFHMTTMKEVVLPAARLPTLRYARVAGKNEKGGTG